MLSFDILADNDHVYSFEPACLLPRQQRFSKGTPQNDWEHALLYVQENDAPQVLGVLCGIPNETLILRYCAAYVLLGKRARLLHPDRVDNWYMLLDDRTALDNFDGDDFFPHTLGRLRYMYGIEWLHARAMRQIPLQTAWFAGQYWQTRWSSSTPGLSPKRGIFPQYHNIERWSFCEDQWHIQHWLCNAENPSEYSSVSSIYTSQVASPLSIQEALDRTLLLGPTECLKAWDSIPAAMRAIHLLDWAITDPEHDAQVLSYLSRNIGANINDLSTRLDLARALTSSGATIVQSLTVPSEKWSIPQD